MARTEDCCIRCGGLTVPDTIVEALQGMWGRRCVLCGDRLDAVILANRSKQKRREQLDRLKAGRKKKTTRRKIGSRELCSIVGIPERL